MPSMRFALVDCNNFFASCEQVFSPKLAGKPLVILSNNDGCIIARSKEAKALGIKMGEPLFQCREFLQKHKVHVLSSNFTLYGDLSSRVMTILEGFGYPVEVYSIDEAFIHLPEHLSVEEMTSLAEAIKERVRQWVGLPIAIGLGPTKTLAKAANRIAKKQDGVFALLEKEEIEKNLAKFSPEDIWGIGRRSGEKLKSYGIQNALQLIQCKDSFFKGKFSVFLVRTVWELRGICCFEEEGGPEHPKSITCSRSFGKKVLELSELKEAVASYIANASQRLRNEQVYTSRLHVFVCTDHLHGSSATFKLPMATSYTPELIHYGLEMTTQLFKKGTSYKKAGVILEELVPEQELQLDLFSNQNLKKREAAMHMIDAINSRFDKKTIHFAAEGTLQPWRMRSARRTPRFTSSWDELPIVNTSLR